MNTLNISTRLRDAARKLRGSSIPLSDFIPLIQSAADILDKVSMPLTDAQLFQLLKNCDDQAARLPHGFRLFAREIETAHGISQPEPSHETTYQKTVGEA